MGLMGWKASCWMYAGTMNIPNVLKMGQSSLSSNVIGHLIIEEYFHTNDHWRVRQQCLLKLSTYEYNVCAYKN